MQLDGDGLQIMGKYLSH